MSSDFQTRINALHAWYCRNVMEMRLTPEVERLWLEWLKAGYCGPDLRDAVRYIRRQIALGKRNEGALKLTNLIARGEVGFIGFDQDLGLARARTNLNPMKKLEPAPDHEARAGEAGGKGSRGAEGQHPLVGRDSVEPSKEPTSSNAPRTPNLDAFRKMKEATE